MGFSFHLIDTAEQSPGKHESLEPLIGYVRVTTCPLSGRVYFWYAANPYSKPVTLCCQRSLYSVALVLLLDLHLFVEEALSHHDNHIV